MDESQRSRVAALHAAQVARERGTSLLVLMALPMPVSELSWYPELSPDAEGIAERRRQELQAVLEQDIAWIRDRKSTRLNSSHVAISYAVFCLKKKIK